MDTPRDEIKREARALHPVFNVAVRRLGGIVPACDGPDCTVCRALLAQWEPPQPAPVAEQAQLRALIAKWRECAKAQWTADFKLNQELGIRKHYDASDIQHAVDQCADELEAALASRQPGPSEPQRTVHRSTPCPFCPQETAHSHRVTFSKPTADTKMTKENAGLLGTTVSGSSEGPPSTPNDCA